MARFRKPARWRPLVWLFLCACPLVVFLAVNSELNRRTPFWDKYQKVQLGMTDAEVKDILGPPTDEEMVGSLGPTALDWVQGEQRIIVFFLADPRGELAVKKGFLPKSVWEYLRNPWEGRVITYP
jgi:hypothetical protein